VATSNCIPIHTTSMAWTDPGPVPAQGIRDFPELHIDRNPDVLAEFAQLVLLTLTVQSRDSGSVSTPASDR
jgi:hypothetical protein